MYRVQTHWGNCSTQAAYLSSIVTWADAANDHFFNFRLPLDEDQRIADSLGLPEGSVKAGGLSSLPATQPHPFQLGIAPWVIRSHSLLFYQPASYHEQTAYRSDVAVTSAVTRVGRSSLEVEHAFFHEASERSGRAELLCRSRTSLIVLSEQTYRPAPHGLDGHATLCAAPSFKVPTELVDRPGGCHCLRLMTRPSDVDGHGHVNNAVLVGFLRGAQLARLEARARQGVGEEGGQRGGPVPAERVQELEKLLPAVRSMHVEFLAPALMSEELSVFSWGGEQGSCAGTAQPGFHEICRADGAVLVRARVDVEPLQKSASLTPEHSKL